MRLLTFLIVMQTSAHHVQLTVPPDTGMLPISLLCGLETCLQRHGRPNSAVPQKVASSDRNAP